MWQGSNPDAQSTGGFLFVHNDFFASSGALGQLGQNGAVLFGAGASQYTAYAGRIINNLFFGKWTNQQGQMFQHGIIDSFQNNLIVLDPRLELYDDNGTKVFDMAGFQTKMCTSPKQVFAGGNVGISAAVSSLFKNFAGDDAAYANLEAADFTPLTSAFAIGLDTTQSLCGGIHDNTADACTGARGSETCGNVTVDAAGVTRPAMPSAGAFEPAP